jgi:hypothetical protein
MGVSDGFSRTTLPRPVRCHHPTRTCPCAGNNFNSGVMLFKSSPTSFRFLKAAYLKMHNLNSPWWEQQSFIELLAEQ